MKALSIRQPWAWAILNAGKKIENRTWASHYTGPFLIHASKTFDNHGYNWLIRFKQWIVPSIPHPDDYEFGGIVGMGKIIDCVSDSYCLSSQEKFWFSGPWGFVLNNIKPLPFYSCKGQLGFFEVNYSVETERGEG